MNYLTELIRLRDDEGTSGWAKETAKSILALKDRFESSEITSDKFIEGLESLRSGDEEAGPGSINNRAVIDNGIENLKKLEKENGFVEAINDKETGKKKQFFNLGPENDWKKLLDTKLKQDIEKEFETEMRELGYI